MDDATAALDHYVQLFEKSWINQARPEQIKPFYLDWSEWLILTGRGWGKTRTGAEWCVDFALKNPNSRIALIGASAADVRDTMVEGESGILASLDWRTAYDYEPSKRRIVIKNGSRFTFFSAEKPRQLRGVQHHAAWADELCAWQYVDEAMMNLRMGLRLGGKPKLVITTTPKPLPIIKEFIASDTCHVTTGSTYDNKDNLPTSYIDKVKEMYEGTSIGRQELYGEVIMMVDGALWNWDIIQQVQTPPHKAPRYSNVIISIDPALSATTKSDETGIIVLGYVMETNMVYVISDLSGNYDPAKWAKIAIDAWRHYGASFIIAEKNVGGDMIETVLRQYDDNIAYKGIQSKISKQARAEPVFTHYERGLVKHITGNLDKLEAQMCEWEPTNKWSPDRMDAMVQGVNYFTEKSLRKGIFKIIGVNRR